MLEIFPVKYVMNGMELKPKATLFGNFIPVFLYFPSGHTSPALPRALLHYAGVKLLLEDHEMLWT